jgi:hypothetical protein
MKINYNDLKTLVDDFRYIVQTGGNPFAVSGGGVGSASIGILTLIVSFLKSIIYLIVFLFIIYLVYIILFKGYPKILMDLLSLGFYKKSNLDGLFSEHKFFENHYKFLLKLPSEFNGLDPHTTFGKLVKPNNIKNLMQSTETSISAYYKNFKYTRRYVEAFREYFLYFYKLDKEYKNTNNKDTCSKYKCIRIWKESLYNPNFKPPQCKASTIETDFVVGVNQTTSANKVDCPADQFVIEYPEFYDTLLEYQIKNGSYKGGTKTKGKYRDQRLAELYYFDSVNKTNYFKRVKELNLKISALAKEVASTVKSLNESQLSLFIIIPTIADQNTKSKFSEDYQKNFSKLSKSAKVTIHDPTVRYLDFNEYTWYVFEVLYTMNNGLSYDALKGELTQLLSGTPYEMSLLLTSYINLPQQSKQKAESTLVLNYQNIDVNKKFFQTLEWINKHPIFSHIYFNTKLTDSNKSGLYKKVIDAYDYFIFNKKVGSASVSNLFATASTYPKNNPNIGMLLIENLTNNARHFKEYINAVNILDLYLNTYHEDFCKLYAEQYRSNVKFFQEMWDPYFNEIFNMKIMQYYRRMTEGRNTSKSFSRFLKLWRVVGRMVRQLKTEIGKAFKRGMKVPDEQPAPQG